MSVKIPMLSPSEKGAEASRASGKPRPAVRTGKREVGLRWSLINLKGSKHGRWTVISYSGHQEWLCRCECGTQKNVNSQRLRNGVSKSCGCLRSELTTRNKTTHGGSKTRTYRIWAQLFTRCYNPNFDNWDRYGGRGITVSRRWHDFRNFLADMGTAPPGLSLDRKDNNGNYTKRNCRWATKLQQSNNTSTNRIVVVDGISDTIANHARRTGVKYNTMRYRARNPRNSHGL